MITVNKEGGEALIRDMPAGSTLIILRPDSECVVINNSAPPLRLSQAYKVASSIDASTAKGRMMAQARRRGGR